MEMKDIHDLIKNQPDIIVDFYWSSMSVESISDKYKLDRLLVEEVIRLSSRVRVLRGYR